SKPPNRYNPKAITNQILAFICIRKPNPRLIHQAITAIREPMRAQRPKRAQHPMLPCLQSIRKTKPPNLQTSKQIQS
ncbi:MAG: hypothetical protein LAT54_09780, partial [Cryomorphaceae bacterium]|nr:hypothetical protein [Cryomorphaceae bacterium]